MGIKEKKQKESTLATGWIFSRLETKEN